MRTRFRENGVQVRRAHKARVEVELVLCDAPDKFCVRLFGKPARQNVERKRKQIRSLRVAFDRAVLADKAFDERLFDVLGKLGVFFCVALFAEDLAIFETTSAPCAKYAVPMSEFDASPLIDLPFG